MPVKNPSLQPSALGGGDSTLVLKPIFDALPGGVLVVRGNGDIVHVNPPARRVIDLSNRLPTSLIQMALTAIQCGSVEIRSVDGRQLAPPGAPETRNLTIKIIPLILGQERLAVLLMCDARDTGRPNPHAPDFYGLVGQHPKMTAVYQMIREVGPLDVPVLIQGDSGTGKELVARALHQVSRRAGGNLIAMNCSALADGVLESELFGHVRGAFSGAIRDRKGRFELADGGTLFLDEIGELTPSVQAKLLRVLQDGTFERVGDCRTLRADARIICATNRNLDNEVAGGRYRADLYYRFSVIVIQLPALRDRRSDIPLLVDHLIAKASRDFGMEVPPIESEVMTVLREHHWPGNVRQLENVLRHAAVRSAGRPVRMEHLPVSLHQAPRLCSHLTTSRKNLLTSSSVSDALEKVDGNRSRAAKLLGVSRATLYRFLSE